MAKVTTSLFGEVALLPVQPQAPMRETLEWFTDILPGQSGAEEAIQLRSAPRQSFAYTYPEQDTVKQMTFNVQYGAIKKLWAIPLWSEAQLVGALADDEDTITADTDLYSLRADSLAFLYQSPTKYQLVEIDTAAGGEVVITTPVDGAFTSAWLMPARVGHVVKSFSRKTSGYGNVTDVTWEVQDNAELDEGDAPTQFLSNDIYFDAPEVDGAHDLNTRIDRVDYQLGIVGRRFPWTYNRVGRSHRVMCEDATEVAAFRQWLGRRAGKKRRFWEPSFQNDLRKRSTGTVTTAFVVDSDSLLEWTLQRTHIAFQLDDGSWLTRTINSTTQLDPDRVQLTLSSSLGGIDARRIVCVSWLGLKRLDTDRIEIEWIGNGVMNASLNTTELQP